MIVNHSVIAVPHFEIADKFCDFTKLGLIEVPELGGAVAAAFGNCNSGIGAKRLSNVRADVILWVRQPAID
jgi:hypothetical protein